MLSHKWCREMGEFFLFSLYTIASKSKVPLWHQHRTWPLTSHQNNENTATTNKLEPKTTKSLSFKHQLLNLKVDFTGLIGRLRLLRAGFQHICTALVKCVCSCCVSDTLGKAVYTKTGSVESVCVSVCIDCLTWDADVMSTRVCVRIKSCAD